MSQQLTQTRSGSILIPKELRRKWGNVSVYITPSENTLVIQKMQKPLQRLSDIAKRTKLPRMSPKAIEKEIAAYRRSA